MKIQKALLIGGLLSTLAGCGGSGVVDNVWNEITLEPGDDEKCLGTPCQVYYMLPPLDGGTYVISNRGGQEGNLKMGAYQAGTKAYFGKLWPGQYEFIVEGTALPATRLVVLGSQ